MKTLMTTLLLGMSVVCLGNEYTLSSNGEEHIKSFEKCSLTSYWDANGYSIGYGHHGKDVKKNQRISQTQAEKLFSEDVKEAQDGANRLLASLPYKYKFNQSFYDGLCDLVYNCGEGGVRQSEFYRRLKRCRVRNGKMNNSDYEYTLSAVKTCRISCDGHKTRRKATHLLMGNLKQ